MTTPEPCNCGDVDCQSCYPHLGGKLRRMRRDAVAEDREDEYMQDYMERKRERIRE